MGDKIVRPERRRFERRRGRLASAVAVEEDAAWRDHRTHCWDLERECGDERRRKCGAHFVRRNCWDLWAAEYFPPGRKPCCHADVDCSECPIAVSKFAGSVQVFVPVPQKTERRSASGERDRTHCSFLYCPGDNPVERGDANGRASFRCRRRYGIELDGSYVTEVCGSPEHRECIFFATE